MVDLHNSLLNLFVDHAVSFASGALVDNFHLVEALLEVLLNLLRVAQQMASLVGDELVKVTLLHALPVLYVIVVDFFDLWPVNDKLERIMASHFAPVLIHPFALFFCNVSHFWFFFSGWHVLLDPLTLSLLLLDEYFEQLFEIKLELVSIALFLFFELLNSDYVLAEAVLHLFGQHQLLFVEAKEDLQMHEVALVVLALIISCVPFYVHARATTVVKDTDSGLVLLFAILDLLAKLFCKKLTLAILLRFFGTSVFTRNQSAYHAKANCFLLALVLDFYFL